jgi:hypothetical protein
VTDYTLEYLKKHDIPVTRENYVLLNWLGDVAPDNLPAELEAELPKELQSNTKEKENE